MAKSKKNKPVNWRKPTGKAIDAIGAAALERLKTRLGLNTEVKMQFDNYPVTAMTASWSAVLPPPTIAEGTTDSSRDGSSIRVTRTDIRGIIRPNSVDTKCRVVRVVAVYQPNPNGTVVTAANMFNNTGAVDSVYGADSFSLDISVIYDKSFEIGPDTQALSNATFHITDQRLDHHMVWKSADTTGSNSNLLQGGITVFVIEDAGANFATVEIHRSTSFVDN